MSRRTLAIVAVAALAVTAGAAPAVAAPASQAPTTIQLPGTAGTLVSRTTNAGFDMPTTIAEYGDRLYLPNARFSTPPSPTTPYTAVGVPQP